MLRLPGLVVLSVQMRRVLSILLALFFGLGPLAATFEAQDDARLPACCRRNGAHHCDMTDTELARAAQAASPSAPVFSAPSHCPLYPTGASATNSPAHALTASAAKLYRSAAQNRVLADSQQVSSDSVSRAHTVRGPPAPAFS